MLDATTKKQLKATNETHKKINETFLETRIVPRVVVFMADGTNMSKKKSADEKHEVAIFTKRGPNNVAININKFIAKYDFDIAMKLKKNLTEKEEMEREEKERIKREIEEIEEAKPTDQEIKY